MNTSAATAAVTVALLGAAAFAALPPRSGTPATPAPAPEAARHSSTLSAATLPVEPALPAGHPAIRGHAPSVLPSDEPQSLVWSVPRAWHVEPNPNAMRLATYRVPGARVSGDAELTVVRAGGTTEANIQRWIGQFERVGKDERTVREGDGVRITVVTVSGTYLGSGMSGAPAEAHPGWTLRAAIVDAKGSPYFFKMTGPADTVRDAAGAFDELLASIRPSGV